VKESKFAAATAERCQSHFTKLDLSSDR